jgi:hypothetical protein
MKRALPVFVAVWAIAVLTLCNSASGELVPAVTLDYQYHATAQNGLWTEVTDPGNFGAPDWFTFPFSPDQWLAVPNQEQLGKMKELWLQVQWEPGIAVVPVDPIVWTPQGFVVSGGTNPIQSNNTYIWHWTIIPQPGSEVFQFPNSFPWTGVTGIDVATRCVDIPEPSTLGLVISGLFGLVLVWRQRKTA